MLRLARCAVESTAGGRWERARVLWDEGTGRFEVRGLIGPAILATATVPALVASDRRHWSGIDADGVVWTVETEKRG